MSRQESEAVSELKNLTGKAKLPYGSLALGTEGIRQGGVFVTRICPFVLPVLGSALTNISVLTPSAILTFEEAKQADVSNERMPPPTANNIMASIAELDKTGSRSALSTSTSFGNLA